MVLRSMPRRLRLAALSLPLVVTASCSTSTPVPPPEPAAKAQLTRDEAGACWVIETTSSNCPPDAMCNPPPPRRVDCPDDVTLLTSDHFKPKPKPVVWRDAAGKCWQDVPIVCPPPEVATCNPPPPQPVPCPDDPTQLSSDAWKPPHPPELPDLPQGPVERRADGNCYVYPPVKCPPPTEGTCNPPPPRRVPCPEEMAPRQPPRNPPSPRAPGGEL